MTTLSVIIPTYQEVSTIGEQITRLFRSAETPQELELIIADGGSTDGTIPEAERQGVQVIRSTKRGRSVQMNTGAYFATGGIFYFLHADSRPPENFDTAVRKAVERGKEVGCFRMRFDRDHPLLRFFGWFTRFRHNLCRGGDQSLFITRGLFERIGGYDPSLTIMEDIDIVKRAKRASPFHVLPAEVITSARRYERNGIYRLQFLFTMIHILYWCGCSDEKILLFYLKHVR